MLYGSWISLLWPVLGLLGTRIYLSRMSNTRGRGMGYALFTLPHAIVFGPFFLFLALSQKAKKECRFCLSTIDERATVCPECTRTQ